MRREYHRWQSPSLGREMELLVFGHGGVPAIVFPSAQGRFYDFEDHGLVQALDGKVRNAKLQLFCVDSLDAESWLNPDVPPRWRIARQLQYQDYVMREVVPLAWQLNANHHLIAIGAGLGGYHAANVALRSPAVFSGFLSMSGSFDMSDFLDGYYDEDCYFNFPTHYLANMTDERLLRQYRQNTYILATGWDDPSLKQNQQLGAVMDRCSIPHELSVWNDRNTHDWATWAKMLQRFL